MFDVGLNDIYVLFEYIVIGVVDYDYGFIFFKGVFEDGFGWLVIILDKELNNCIVSNCGYLVDKL